MTLDEVYGEIYHMHLPYLKNVFQGKTQHFEFEIDILSGGRYHADAIYYPDLEQGRCAGFFLILILRKKESINASINNFMIYKHGSRNLDYNPTIHNKMPQVAQFLQTQIFIGFPSIAHLAKLHLLSVSKLMRDFKRTYKTSPFNYFRCLQMQYASQYMRETKCTKKEISLILGFSNQGNFTNCYNRWLKIHAS
ncbi:helix-turn-helix domain-containing protein [Pedobacter sp.]|uniref:helix-turn-helix domain-containing protein n=1 Tax=Pedobacter sp. TaxID=1411316 RepID=UPI003D7FBA62